MAVAVRSGGYEMVAMAALTMRVWVNTMTMMKVATVPLAAPKPMSITLEIVVMMRSRQTVVMLLYVAETGDAT